MDVGVVRHVSVPGMADPKPALTGLVTIDGWLKLTAPAQTAVLFKELRLTLHSVLKDLVQKPEASWLPQGRNHLRWQELDTSLRQQ
ncbi:hypothetical protein Taro_020539, partial [Colocasia esculenta]|nr:hypothetical protein [Colocasia esculenta]